MASSRRVAALAPARDALAEAREAYDAGAFKRALQILEETRFERRENRVAAAFLQAHILLLLARPEPIVPLIEAIRNDCKNGTEIATSQMLLGTALTRIDRRDEGEALLDVAERYAQRNAPGTQSEIAYFRALSRWTSHRLDEAEQIIDQAVPTSTGIARSRLLQLLGWIDIRRESYGPATHEFTAALEALDTASVVDGAGRAAILEALGSIAAETIDLRLGRFVRREYSADWWPEESPVARFHILESLSWLSLLEGDVGRAWDERQRALTLTADTSYHALALVDAGRIAEIVGDRFAQRRYLELAGSLLLRGDQVALDVDRRMALLAFVAVGSETQPEATARVLELYSRSQPRRTSVHAFEGDRRLEAYEAYARGKFAIARGETQRGIIELDRSLNLWIRLNYRLRAAITALDLRTITADRKYAQIALDELRNAPDAWLRPAIERGTQGNDPLSQLTPAERRVLGELCKGKKSQDIADHFGRSFNTINNHTRAIFTAFGVRSRAALVAECARLGILDDMKDAR